MVSVAYLAFTFLACVLGAGLGLVVFQAWQRKPIPESSIPAEADEQDTWELVQRWQLRENRIFGVCIAICTGLPVAIALAGWPSRGEVVHSICINLNAVAMNSPLCF